MAKHIAIAFLYVLFALLFLFFAIIGFGSGHHNWTSYGSACIMLVYIFCFLWEISKINEISAARKHANAEAKSATERLLRQKQEEQERLRKEIEEDKVKVRELNEEIEELNEEIDIENTEEGNPR